MKIILNFTITLFLFSSQMLFSQKQNIIGFWEVEKVSMGNQSMTPIAKWMKINADGSYQSGNGWLQSAEGTWTFDEKTKAFAAVDQLGTIDKMGDFKVSFDKNNMFFKRLEEGSLVTVKLKAITKTPMAPSDYLEGVWILKEFTKNKVSILDASEVISMHKLFFRWDRIINFYSSSNKKSSGYWHINGHKPEITLLPHNKEVDAESWRISVDETQLIMEGISNRNKAIKRVYTRTNQL